MHTLRDLFPHGLCGLVYDCDGVMINSRAANSLFYNRVLAYFGLPPMTEAEERYTFMATGLQALWHILPERLHPEIDRVVRNEVVYERDIVPRLTLMDGFRDFVLHMQARGFRQAMCTNRTDAGFGQVLSFFSFPPCFDPVMTSSQVAPKPSPEGALAICRAWGCAPEDALFIGDTSHDHDAARAAGMPFVAFNALDCTGDASASSWQEMRALMAPVRPKVLASPKEGS